MLCEQGVQIKPGCRYESAGWRDLIEVFGLRRRLRLLAMTGWCHHESER